ncbi:hypothetical protein [Methylosinus sp. LW4]|uniref:hypothetical protein n=1 Tax=Methylosinus sp. LW4 TaxID=136993 RepID=UPI0012F9DFA1|nr:hypothetical protein [Methylosinus sp. LW4]
MTASFPRRKQPRDLISGREILAALQNETMHPRVQGTLLRKCDETLDCLMEFSDQNTPSPASRGRKRLDQRRGADAVRYIEQMIRQIVATVPASAGEKMGKMAIYREYADFSEGRPEVLRILLRAACDEMEREFLGTAKHTIGDS